MLAGIGCDDFALLWDPSNAQGWGHLPEFWADAGSLPGDFTRFIPGTQDEAARLMDEILTPIPIDLRPVSN